VEDSVSEFSEGGGKKTRQEPTKVVLQTESWRAHLMNKARNGIAGFALAMALTYFLLVSGDRLVLNFVRQLPRAQRRKSTAHYPGFSATDCPVSRGPVGVLLAVPLMTVIQVVLKQIPKLRPVYKVIAC